MLPRRTTAPAAHRSAGSEPDIRIKGKDTVTMDRAITRIGIIGSSWWVDSMYLPALDTLEDARVTAIAGRRAAPLAQRAADWGIPATYTDWREMLAEEELDGVIVAAAIPVHYPAAKASLERGLAVLCEKPLTMTEDEALELAELARVSGAVTMTAFTYAFMPGFQWLRRLVHDGYVGRIHHVGLRYHTGNGLDPAYTWQFDSRYNPTGAFGDIGSHFVHLAIELAGQITHVTAQLDTIIDRADTDDQGQPYTPANDAAIAMLRFDSGAQGLIHASSVAYEGTSMDQRHLIEVHGAEGTLTYEVDWDRLQEVRGTRVGGGPVQPLAIPDDIWGDLRRDNVHDTYRDVFRTTDAMARGWARAIRAGRPTTPDIAAGVDVQRVLAAAVTSAATGRTVEISRK